MNPGTSRTDVSVACASMSRSFSWFDGSTVKTLMSVTTPVFSAIVVIKGLQRLRWIAVDPRIIACREEDTQSSDDQLNPSGDLSGSTLSGNSPGLVPGFNSGNGLVFFKCSKRSP